MNLRSFQEEIRELVFFREKEPASSRLWKDTVPDRLGVYRNNTRSNWTETLDHDFPLTLRQFGEEEWEALRRRYFIKHPPRPNDAIPLGPVKLVAHTVTDDRVVTVGLQLAEPEPVPRTMWDKIVIRARRMVRRLLTRLRRART